VDWQRRPLRPFSFLLRDATQLIAAPLSALAQKEDTRH